MVEAEKLNKELYDLGMQLTATEIIDVGRLDAIVSRLVRLNTIALVYSLGYQQAGRAEVPVNKNIEPLKPDRVTEGCK